MGEGEKWDPLQPGTDPPHMSVVSMDPICGHLEVCACLTSETNLQ